MAQLVVRILLGHLGELYDPLFKAVHGLSKQFANYFSILAATGFLGPDLPTLAVTPLPC
jgi:hypothetical protein